MALGSNRAFIARDWPRTRLIPGNCGNTRACWGCSFSGPGPTSCRDFYETGSFSFMHANYDPYLPMDRQPAPRLRWESVEPGRQSHRLAPARGTVAPQLPFAGHDHARGRASEKKIRAKAIAPVRIFPKSLRKCSRGGV